MGAHDIADPMVSVTQNKVETDTNTESVRIRIGICAMDKKARSKPMEEILNRLDQHTFEPVFFGNDVILNEAVEKWPICDVLIAFYSKGYPLEKAEQYVALRKPYLINDLDIQHCLLDRRRVYELLVENGIDVPRHVFVSRDGYVSRGEFLLNTQIMRIYCFRSYQCHNYLRIEVRDGHRSHPPEEIQFEEHDDHIVVNGAVLHKPFVEKPVDSEDHNICIYYPSSAGGGCKKLFRKVGDKSSDFHPDIYKVRRDGSYIYERFIETQGTDVKMCESMVLVTFCFSIISYQ